MNPVPTSAELRRLLQDLAWLRSQSCSWFTCAERLQSTPEYLEDLTRQHPQLWRAAKKLAFHELQEQCLIEGIVVLREQIRDSDLPKKREAAKLMTTLMLRIWPKPNDKTKPLTAKTEKDGLHQYALHLRSLNDDQLEEEILALNAGETSPGSVDEPGRISGICTLPFTQGSTNLPSLSPGEDSQTGAAVSDGSTAGAD